MQGLADGTSSLKEENDSLEQIDLVQLCGKELLDIIVDRFTTMERCRHERGP